MSTKAKLDDWLSVLFWGAETIMFPTVRNLFRSHEDWENQRRMREKFRYWQHQDLLARDERAAQLTYRLTELGRLTLLGGRDPEARWRRSWDGRWRMLLFDLPVAKRRERLRLWRWLRENWFGYLQNSVWITPDSVTEVTEALHEFRDDVECFTVMEASCAVGYADAAIVLGAWDFPKINKRYQDYLSITTAMSRALQKGQSEPAALTHWLRRERLAWLHAVSLDPLLPRVLLPADYAGQSAWQARRVVLGRCSKQLIVGA